MARRKEESQLDKDIRAAERAGYGVHYGRYKAAQYAKEMKQREEKEEMRRKALKAAEERHKKKLEQEAAERGAVPAAEPQQNNPNARVCIHCGKKLPQKKKSYCSPECQREYLEKQREPRLCVICGREREPSSRKYCPECRKQTERENHGGRISGAALEI